MSDDENPTTSPESKKPQPERADTDESLRTERECADLALRSRRIGIERSADELVARAREHADADLGAARSEADHALDGAKPGVRARDVVAGERAREGEILEQERAAADATLHREREEHVRALAALRPLERERTDRHLLTERARSDDALEHRDDFLGMVSHDLRNLLGGIALKAALLSAQSSESDDGRRTVAGMKDVQRYVARMNRLIGDLLDVASIDAGRLSVQSERCDAVALVAEAVEMFAQAAQEKGIALESEIVDGPLLGELDRERMLQVLANLITNAIKFSARGGRITVRGARDGDGLHLSVQDTGAGIPSDMLEAVFERFWRVGTDDRRGLGLGLYISRCIVDAQGGRIWAESTLGEGSVFHCTIPGALTGSAN